MKNIIIGTAGHIDHGKTTLIKAITGRETDRLKEEKKRGITIELGFTYFDLPSGRRAGIIDVPGHEKFIKNMLAGVIGMDIVALVVAADEGIMPQTKEHLNILNLLNIKKGLVVITKADTVDDEWLQLVKEDIQEHLNGTFLEGSPILPVSSINGKGIDAVVNTIDELTDEIEDRDVTETPRLPVDRAFTITGHGTIVTGTLIAGKFNAGDEVQIFPNDKVARIRSIQVHGVDSDTAYAGQRVAINLAGLKKSEINRGDIIAPINSMEVTMMLDVKLKLLKDSPRIIENRSRVRLYIGSSEVLCRVVLLDREQLTPGEERYAQLRLEEKIVAKREDKFIIRFYSPMTTIGGGEILEPNPPKRKRYDTNVIEELKVKEKGDIQDVVENIIKEKSKSFPSINEISIATVIPEEKILKIVSDLKERSSIITFTLSKDIHVIHREHYKLLSKQIEEELTKYHIENPLKSGIFKEELRSKYLGNIKSKLGDSFITGMIDNHIIKQSSENISLIEFKVEFNTLQQKIKEAIESAYLEDRFSPMKKEDILSGLKFSKQDLEQVYDALIDLGILVRLSEEIIMHDKAYLESIEKVKVFIKENGSITLSQFRDLLKTSRKYAVTLLENFDQRKITMRDGDKRILY